MAAIQRISGPTFERRPDDRVAVRFKLNQRPDDHWTELFKRHAGSSALDGAHAVFAGAEVSIEVRRPQSMAELATALDCFIECANLRLRSFPGEESPRRSKRVEALKHRVRL